MGVMIPLDSVWHSGLLYKMHQNRFNLNTITLVKLEPTTYTVKIHWNSMLISNINNKMLSIVPQIPRLILDRQHHRKDYSILLRSLLIILRSVFYFVSCIVIRLLSTYWKWHDSNDTIEADTKWMLSQLNKIWYPRNKRCGYIWHRVYIVQLDIRYVSNVVS